MPLTLKEFIEANVERCKCWHGPEGVAAWTPERWMTATVGELGEAANVMKKMFRILDGIANKSDDPARQVSTLEDARRHLAKELADTFHYLVLTAVACDIDLEAATIEVFNATSEKYGFPNRIGR